MKRFLKFGSYAPDSNDRDTEDMERIENALPIFNSYRSIKKKLITSSTDVGDNVNSCYIHFYTKLIGAQVGYPTSHANNSDGVWVGIGGDTDETDLWKKIDDGVPNDNDRIVASDSPSVATALVKLTNLQTPTSGDRTINYRYKVTGVSGTWTLDIDLLEPDDGSTYTGSITQVSGSSDHDEWQEGSFVITTTGVSDWNDLYIRIKATVPGDGDQVGYCDADFYNIDLWVNESDSILNLNDSIDATTPVDDSYIMSPTVKSGDSTEVIFDMESLEDPVIHTGHVITYREKASAENLNSEIQLLEEGDVIAENTVTDMPTTFTENTLTLDSSEAEEIKRYSNLKIRYRVYADEDVGDTVTSSDFYPSNEIGDSGTTWVASNNTKWEDVGNNSDTIASDGNANVFVTFRITASDPGTDKNHVLSIKAKSDSNSNNSIWMKLWQGSTQILDGTFPNNASLKNRWYISTTTSFQTFTYNLSETEASRITNYEILNLRIYMANEVTGTVEKAYITLDVDSNNIGRSAKLSQVKWTLPDEARMEVSQVNLEIPTTYSSSVGDITDIYLGVPENLYQVESSGFTDVSRSSGPPAYQDLTSTNEYAHSWSFCSWGTSVIATNFVDPVQKRAPADSAFSDLITSTHVPQGRFVATVSNFLVLAKIKYSGSLPDGEADEVWWSAFDDNTDFDPDPVTQSDRQRLVMTPGEITGLVGGEYGIIFKRNSIYRMNFVGSPLIFTFDLISINEGTKFHRSIVPVGNDIYFYGNGSFWVIRNGSVLDRIGDGVVTKTLIDEEFESNAIRIIPSDGTILQETIKESVIIGTYDRLSGLIYWSIGLQDDSDFRNSFILVYNPVENRFGSIKDSNLMIASINSLPVSEDVGNSITRNVFGISMGSGSSTTAHYFYFNDDDTYDVVFETKILSSAFIGRTERGIGENITIRSVRPIYRGDPNFSQKLMSIKLEVSDDELMLENVDSDTVTLESANPDGWAPLELMSGEFFRFTVTIPSVSNSSVKEFDGLSVDWVPHGSF